MGTRSEIKTLKPQVLIIFQTDTKQTKLTVVNQDIAYLFEQ